MNIINIVLISVIGAIFLASFIATMTTIAKKRKAKKNGVVAQSSEEAKVVVPSPVNVSLEKKDIVVAAHATIKVEKGGRLSPGKYTMLSADSEADKFNVRVGKFVREYKHGDVLVLSEGEEVTPTSHTIILR